MRDGELFGTFRKFEKEIARLSSEFRTEITKTNTVLNSLILYLSHRQSFEYKWKWMNMIRNYFAGKFGFIDIATLQKFIMSQIQQNKIQMEQAAEKMKAEKIKKDSTKNEK